LLGEFGGDAAAVALGEEVEVEEGDVAVVVVGVGASVALAGAAGAGEGVGEQPAVFGGDLPAVSLREVSLPVGERLEVVDDGVDEGLGLDRAEDVGGDAVEAAAAGLEWLCGAGPGADAERGEGEVAWGGDE
jgi:hypothetical protein